MLPHSNFEDIPCCVHIPVEDKPAAETDVYSDFQCLWNPVSTLRAQLAGVCRIYGNHYTRGTFSLLREDGAKHTPGGICDAFVQASLLAGSIGQELPRVFSVWLWLWPCAHVIDGQFLKGDQTVGVDNPSGELMYEVVPAVSDTLVDASDNFLCLAAFSTPSLLESEFTLCFRQGFFIYTEETRVYDVLLVVGDGEMVETDINTDPLFGKRKRFSLGFHGKADKPLSSQPSNRAGFDLTVYRSVKVGLNGSDLAEADRLFESLETGLRVGDAIVLSSAFEARIARIFTGMNPAKESIEGKADTLRHILQDL
jgi:hypothetical protein